MKYGIVERLVTFGLVLVGQYNAVGLIAAAKAILRFHDYKQSEYVVAGTFLSLSIAIFLALAVSLL